MPNRPRDPYLKLRPDPPTPPDEICACADGPPVVLRPRLGPNPLACLRCNAEAPPERIGLSESLADEIAGFRDFHGAFDHLWLDSGEFEAFAAAELANPTSVVNRRGLQLVERLARVHEAYYGWFQDGTAEPPAVFEDCPACGRSLETYAGRFPRKLCRGCRIALYDQTAGTP